MDAPVFVVGNDRSGTTMLRLILDRGDLAIPPESLFLADFAGVRRAGGLGQREAAERFARRVWGHPRVRAWGLEGEPPQLPGGLSHEAAYRFCVEAPFSAYAAAQGKSRWGDKTPPYVNHVDELLAIWPDARVIVLVRDGRDVALSVMRMPWGPNNVWTAARWWAAGIRAGRAAQERWPKNTLEVRYEDIVADPAREAARICAFAGIEFTPEMLAIEQSERSKVVEQQGDWFTSIWAGINTSAVGKWRTAMSAEDQALFAAAAGNELAALGYEVGPAGAPGTARRLGYEAQNAARRAVNLVKLRLIEERGRELRYAIRRKLVRT